MADRIPTELLDDVPAALGDLIGAIGRGVADAQHALDSAAIEQLTAIAEAPGHVAEALRAIGYQPTWYRIPELNAEINLSLTLAAQGERVASGPLRLYATPIDASFSNKYVVNAEVASRISFTVVPVPPAPQATELRVVPDLRGQTWDQASDTLTQLGIDVTRKVHSTEGINSSDEPASDDLRADDSDRVVRTLPEAGVILLPGVKLVVTTAKPQSAAT